MNITKRKKQFKRQDGVFKFNKWSKNKTEFSWAHGQRTHRSAPLPLLLPSKAPQLCFRRGKAAPDTWIPIRCGTRGAWRGAGQTFTSTQRRLTQSEEKLREASSLGRKRRRRRESLNPEERRGGEVEQEEEEEEEEVLPGCCGASRMRSSSGSRWSLTFRRHFKTEPGASVPAVRIHLRLNYIILSVYPQFNLRKKWSKFQSLNSHFLQCFKTRRTGPGSAAEPQNSTKLPPGSVQPWPLAAAGRYCMRSRSISGRTWKNLQFSATNTFIIDNIIILESCQNDVSTCRI